jgi:hypothetical protein
MKTTVIAILLMLTCFLASASEAPDTINLGHSAPVLTNPLSPAGIWQFGADGAIFEIRPQNGRNGVFDLYILESPDLTVPSGALFGHMESTGTANHYDATLFKSLSGKEHGINRRKTNSFIFTFDPASCSLSIRPYKRGTRVNILRWIPYLFRLSVDRSDSRPAGIDGARRLAPVSPNYPVVL